MTTLPRDNDNTPIPALRLRPNGAHQIAATTATSTANAIAFDEQTRVVSLYATTDMYINCGESGVSVDTTGHFIPAGLYYDMAIGGDKTLQTPYIAAMAVSSNGTLYISEKH